MTAQDVPTFVQICIHIALSMGQLCTSTFYIFGKVSLASMNPVIFAAIRALIGAVALVPVVAIVDRNFTYEYRKEYKWRIMQSIPNLKHFLLLSACGLSLTLNQVLFISGLHFTSAGISALFGPICVIWAKIISVAMKNEKFSLLKGVGIILSVAGALTTVTLMVTFGSSGGFNFSSQALIGCILLLLNTIMWSTFVNVQTYVMIKHHIPPLSVSMWSLFTSFIFTSVCSTVFYSEYSRLAGLSWQVWYGVFYGGIIGACVPWTLGTLASKLVKPTVVVIHGTMLPIWTNILSFILLGEIIPWYVAVGALVIISGVMLVAYATYKENKEAAPKPLAEQEPEPEPVVELKELDNVLDQNLEEP